MDNKKTIAEFLSQEYKDFALYTIENRAIPSVIDGFKPSQRKIIYICNELWKTGNEKALKVFQLAGKVASDAYYHHGNCLDYNTEIITSDGVIKIGEWCENHSDLKLDLISYDEDESKYVTGIGHSPRVGAITNEEYEIEMEDGSVFKCTSNHPFYTQRGWVKAENLTDSDDIKGVHQKNVKIKSIKKTVLEEPKKFYDITVDKYHNFVIGSKSMILTHNSSLESAIITMAQVFKNNMALLDEIGQFGSLRSPTPGAARYIGTKLNSNFRSLYKDFELLNHKEEEGAEIEPEYFLPIIPTVLVNGSSGIAVGFASNILNRDPLKILIACEKLLKGRNISDIEPFNNFFDGEYIQDEENAKKWYIRGNFKRINTSTVEVTELPLSMTYEKYDSYLDSLVDNKSIVSYDDNSKETTNYKIKFTRESLSNLDDVSLIKLLKLEESQTEIFTTLDEHGKLKIFETSKEIIEYFVNFRMTFYVKRKEYLLDKLSKELVVLSNRAKFIKLILDNELEIRNRPRKDVNIDCEKFKLDKVDDSYDYLLRMSIWSLTKELFDKLNSDFKTKQSEIKELKKVDPKDMYLNDLSDLKKLLKK